jgi:transcriptional regulator with XRE-family HTH domain
VNYGSPSSESFIHDLANKEFRDEFVSDQVRTRIALLIRALREQDDRNWSQTELGSKMGKPQNVISRLEDPEYGKMNLQTLLEVAAAFDLPLWVDIPDWDEWLRKIRDVPRIGFRRHSFDPEMLIKQMDNVRQESLNTANGNESYDDRF